jgi:tRNA-dihydrouridine synthase B
MTDARRPLYDARCLLYDIALAVGRAGCGKAIPGQCDVMTPDPKQTIPSGTALPYPAMKIGPMMIWPPVQLAALAGYSDGAMRTLCRSFGAPYAVGEMILDAPVLISKTIRKHMRLWEQDHPIAAQITCSTLENSTLAAQTLVDMGYDAIEINMACPVTKLLRRGRGGAFLKDSARAIEFLETVRRSISPEVPLSLKLRIGWDETPESLKKFYEILDGAIQLGVAAVTVHGRTVLQQYRGSADWDALARVRKFVGNSICLMGSGDVMQAQDVFRMLDATGVHGVSIARGAIGKPWIFRQVLDRMQGREPVTPDYMEQGRIIRHHFDLAMQLYNDEQFVGRHLRKFGIYYSKFHPHAKRVRLAFLAVTNNAQWNAAIDEWYGKEGAPALHAAEPPEHAPDHDDGMTLGEAGELELPQDRG